MASLRTLFISLLAALMLAAAPTASAIVDGSDDTDHDYVVFVGQQVQLPNGTWVNGSACSGVLVAPTIVLTAAHCTLGPPPSFPQRAVVRQGESIFAPEAAALGTYNLHPGFCIGCPGAPEGFANNDLAVVVLSSPLPGPYANLPKLGFTEKHFEKKEKKLARGGVRPLCSAQHGPRHSSLGAGRRGDRLERPELPVPPGAQQEEVRHGLRR